MRDTWGDGKRGAEKRVSRRKRGVRQSIVLTRILNPKDELQATSEKNEITSGNAVDRRIEKISFEEWKEEKKTGSPHDGSQRRKRGRSLHQNSFQPIPTNK